MKPLPACLLAAVVAWPLVAAAAVPATLSVQGVLRNNQGALQTMAVNLEVRFFPDATSSVETDQELITGVAIRSGVFSVSVPVTDATIFATPQWIEITVLDPNGGMGEVLPRFALTTVPYAFHAQLADDAARVGNHPAADFVQGVQVQRPLTYANALLTLSSSGCPEDGTWTFDGGTWSCVAPTLYGAASGGGLSSVGGTGLVEFSIAAGAVTTPRIGDGQVTAAKLALLSVGTGALQAGSVTAEKMAAASVNSAHVVDGTLLRADLSATDCTSGQVWKRSGASGWVCADDVNTQYAAGVGGGLALSGANEFTVAAGAVTSAHVADGTLARSDLNQTDCTTGQVWKRNGTTGWVCAADDNPVYGAAVGGGLSLASNLFSVAAGGVDTTRILDGDVTTADLRDLNVTRAKLAACAGADQVLRFDGTGWVCSADVVSIALAGGAQANAAQGAVTISAAAGSGDADYIQNRSVTQQAAANIYMDGAVRMGTETNSPLSVTLYPAGSTGLVVRRVVSVGNDVNAVVAGTNDVSLQRTGDAVSVFKLVNSNATAARTAHCTGLLATGVAVNKVLALPAATNVALYDAVTEAVVSMDCSFGDLTTPGHTTQVKLQRTGTSAEQWVGTLTSTFNQ